MSKGGKMSRKNILMPIFLILFSIFVCRIKAMLDEDSTKVFIPPLLALNSNVDFLRDLKINSDGKLFHVCKNNIPVSILNEKCKFFDNKISVSKNDWQYIIYIACKYLWMFFDKNDLPEEQRYEFIHCAILKELNKNNLKLLCFLVDYFNICHLKQIKKKFQFSIKN